MSPAIDSPLSSRISSPVGRGRDHSREECDPVRGCHCMQSGRTASRPGALPLGGRWAAVTGLPRSLLSSEGRSRVPGRPTRPGLTCPVHLGFSPCPPASLTLRPHAPTAHSLMPSHSGACAPSLLPHVSSPQGTAPTSCARLSPGPCGLYFPRPPLAITARPAGADPRLRAFCCRPLPRFRPSPQLFERCSSPCLGRSEAPP